MLSVNLCRIYYVNERLMKGYIVDDLIPLYKCSCRPVSVILGGYSLSASENLDKLNKRGQKCGITVELRSQKIFWNVSSVSRRKFLRLSYCARFIRVIQCRVSHCLYNRHWDDQYFQSFSSYCLCNCLKRTVYFV